MEKKIAVVYACTGCENESEIQRNKSSDRHVEVYTQLRRICLECGHDMKVVVRVTTITSEAKTETI